MPKLDSLEKSAASLRLPFERTPQSLRVELEPSGVWLRGVSMLFTSQQGRTTQRLRFGQTPRWAYRVRTLGILGAAAPMWMRASLHPFNDAAKVCLVLSLAVLIPFAIVEGKAERHRARLLRQAEALERPGT